MIAVALLGLTVRLGYVFIYQYHVHIGGDSFYYHYGANLLATGHGFIQPYDYLSSAAGSCRPPSIRRSTSSCWPASPGSGCTPTSSTRSSRA